ncbi:hypothetical protein MTBLM5_190010 [Magnetospirillum sp. LM-5]|uniref:hypothetical protein n=1 Tax=Magnetospirillum sp. LM-5 TaxID=2681466 RepID=UPI00137D321F|nr:hypothetical protein [Magnetospirillum sp. LM-5]CAA7616079.1 hypothetical protein MTBLM5_190010 [Magnetospirillum sp. LM-5]
MTTYSNDQANLLLGNAATFQAYNDVPGRGTIVNDVIMDPRTLAPGYELEAVVYAGQEGNPPTPGSHQARLDGWVNASTGNAIIAFAGTYDNAADWRSNVDLVRDEFLHKGVPTIADYGDSALNQSRSRR